MNRVCLGLTLPLALRSILIVSSLTSKPILHPKVDGNLSAYSAGSVVNHNYYTDS